jgi:hypothetical protein
VTRCEFVRAAERLESRKAELKLFPGIQNGIGSCQKIRQYNRTSHPGHLAANSVTHTPATSLILAPRPYKASPDSLDSSPVCSPGSGRGHPGDWGPTTTSRLCVSGGLVASLTVSWL